MRAARRPWSSRPFGVAAERRLGPAARRRVRADQGNGRPLAGKAASNSSVMPGLPSSPGASNSEGDDARVRWQDAVICVPVPRVPCLRGCSRRCCPVSLRGPGQHAVVLPDQFHRLMGRTCPGTGQEPSLGRKREEGVRGMGSLHVPRLAWPRRARPRRGRRGRAALAVAVLAALTLVSGAQHAAYGCHRSPLRRDRGGGAGHRAGGELRHRRPGRGLQRHLGQRLRQQLPLRRGRPRDHRRHRRTPPARGADDMGWTTAGQWFNYTVNVATAGTYTRRLPGVLAVRDHRRAAHRQLLRHQPDRRGRRPQHRRLRDLDHGRRQRHPAGRRSRR